MACATHAGMRPRERSRHRMWVRRGRGGSRRRWLEAIQPDNDSSPAQRPPVAPLDGAWSIGGRHFRGSRQRDRPDEAPAEPVCRRTSAAVRPRERQLPVYVLRRAFARMTACSEKQDDDRDLSGTEFVRQSKAVKSRCLRAESAKHSGRRRRKSRAAWRRGFRLARRRVRTGIDRRVHRHTFKDRIEPEECPRLRRNIPDLTSCARFRRRIRCGAERAQAGPAVTATVSLAHRTRAASHSLAAARGANLGASGPDVHRSDEEERADQQPGRRAHGFILARKPRCAGIRQYAADAHGDARVSGIAWLCRRLQRPA